MKTNPVAKGNKNKSEEVKVSAVPTVVKKDLIKSSLDDLFKKKKKEIEKRKEEHAQSEEVIERKKEKVVIKFLFKIKTYGYDLKI